jgi:phosphoglycolate phosphatase
LDNSTRKPLFVIKDTNIEVFNKIETGHISHVVFDFDGTVSLIRDGWQNVMVPLLIEVLMQTPNHESENEVKKVVIDFVDKLTGKQTIYQMMQLAEEVIKRGGTPKEPLEYKDMYNQRLMPDVNKRIKQLHDGIIDRYSVMTEGAEDFLKALNAKGIKMYLASGTDIEFVKHEAEVLGVAKYFSGGIFGALREYKLFSKEMVIRDILKRFNLHGSSLLVVGDGFVEIKNAKEAGAIALGIYSDENNIFEMNANKRLKLIEAGADILAHDFSETKALVKYLFPN